MTVVLRQVLVEFLQIQTAIDGSKKMGRRNDVFKVEGVEQPLLPARLMAHHVGALRTRWRFANSARRPRRPRVFQQNRPESAGGRVLLSAGSTRFGRKNKSVPFFQ